MQKKLDYTPLGLFFTLLIIYCSLVVYLDNTNITTTNGLYKSISVYRWMQWSRFDIDSGGVLYMPFMALLSFLIPDSLVNSYGYITSFNEYRKLAFINGIFGALTSTIVYLIACSITRNRVWSIGIAIFHAFSGFILVNSIISEDIVPGYFFFILSTYFFYKFLFIKNNRLYLSLTTLSVFASLTLHWTLFPPAAAGYGIAAILLIKQDKKYVRLLIEQIVLFFAVAYIFVVICNMCAGIFHGNYLKLEELVLPGKTTNTAWVGWGIEKINLLILGIGNYLIGGAHITSFNGLDLRLKVQILMGLVITIYALYIVIKSLGYNTPTRKEYIFSSMILTVFLVAQLENLYATGQDPQFQLQPQFIIPFAGILLYKLLKIEYLRKLSYIPICLSVILAGYNVHYLLQHKGKDSETVLEYQKFRELYPKSTTSIVNVGLEGGLTWLWLLDYDASWDLFTKDNFTMGHCITKYGPSANSSDITTCLIQDIEKARAEGKTIIGGTPWLNPDNIFSLSSMNLPKSEAEIIKNNLLANYKFKNSFNVLGMQLAEIEKS